MKDTANEIFGIFEKYKAGQCTYDRALEDAAKVIVKAADNRTIVGYVRSNTLRSVLYQIKSSSKVNSEKTHMFDCKLHQNEMQSIDRMLESMNQ